MAIAIWAKKAIDMKLYRSWYSKLESFTPLKDEGDRMWVGFLVANEVPTSCTEVRGYEELLAMDKWREHHHINPKPLEDKFDKKPKINPEALDKFKEWKKNLFKVPEIKKTASPGKGGESRENCT